MSTKRYSTYSLARETEWKQLLHAVEPSVERGMNLGAHTFKEALEEYEKALDEWFLWKKDKLEQLLLDGDKNRQWSDTITESIKDSTLDFPDWTLLVQEQQLNETTNAAVVGKQRFVSLFVNYDSEFYRKRVFKILKETFMEVFVTSAERRCRELFGPFSNIVDRKLFKVLHEYRQQVEVKLQEVKDQLVQLEQAMKTTQKNIQARDYSDVNRTLVDIKGVVDLFWKKWSPCWDNRETVFVSILDSGLPLAIVTALLNRFMLETPSQGLVSNAQDLLLQDGRLEKLLVYFCQVNPLSNRNLLEWLQDTAYLLCCLSDDQLDQLLLTLETLQEHLLRCKEHSKWDHNQTRVEHLLKLFLSLRHNR